MVHHGHIAAVYDKGSGAVVVVAVRTLAEDGTALSLNLYSIFIRGAGGWGGDRGASARRAGSRRRNPPAS